MITAFRSVLLGWGLVRRGDRVLIAVSGGSDSVALFHLFRSVAPSLGLKLAVAHFNHRLRGSESEGDARFVEKLAASGKTPFSSGAAGDLAQKGRSLQEEARRQRLSFLLRTADRRKCRVVALGHTLDDQAETVLMRFLLEGGPAALGGIHPASHDGRIIHPLLEMKKADLRAWLLDGGASWREDRSNEKPVYTRNRIRLQLLPLLRSRYNSRLDQRLGELSSLLRRDNACLEGQAKAILLKVRRRRGSILFPAEVLTDTDEAVLSRAVLMEIRGLATAGTDVTSRHLASIFALRPGGGFSSVDLPGGVTVGRDRSGLLILGPRAVPPDSAPFRAGLPLPGTARFHRGRSQVTAWMRRRTASFSPAAVNGAPWRCSLDTDTVIPPLTVRSRIPGDRVRLAGAPGSKKLKSLLIDGGISRLLRDRLPVVCDAEGIIWTAGLRPAHRCRVTAATRRLLFLEARGDFRTPL